MTSSLRPVKRYSIEPCFVPLLTSSESFILSYDEYPRPLVRLFNSACHQIMCIYLPTLLVDMCYSSYLDEFLLLTSQCLYKLNPSIGQLEHIDDYELLKENRFLTSLCSTNDHRLFILYRFGEYLDAYPRGKRIWKRRHLCDSICEDISLIRSSHTTDNPQSFLLGLLIVEWNGTWRVDIFSSSVQKLHTGFRFSGWTRDVWLSDWSPYQCWFVGNRCRLMIDSKGQPKNISVNTVDCDMKNITWMKQIDQIKLVVIREERLLIFFK